MAKRRRQKTEQTIIYVVNAVFFVLGIVFVVFSVSLYYIGYHNMDLGQNIRYINAEYHLDLIESSPEMTGEELFRYGVDQMNRAFLMFGLSMVLVAGGMKKFVF